MWEGSLETVMTYLIDCGGHKHSLWSRILSLPCPCNMRDTESAGPLSQSVLGNLGRVQVEFEVQGLGIV